MTVRHGSRHESWNTTARSGPGRDTFLPLIRISPLVAGIKPSTTNRNVVLPHPDGPTIDTNSFSTITRSSPESATRPVPELPLSYARLICRDSNLTFMIAPRVAAH